MKSKYLLDLLRHNSRVIIPKFGAFLLKSKPNSDYDLNLNISFNDFLKFDDGVLIEYIAKTDNIDKFEAENQVSEFVTEIQKNLLDNQKFYFDGIGTILKDKNGTLVFEKKAEKAATTPEIKKQSETIKKTKTVFDSLKTNKIQDTKPEIKPESKIKKVIVEQPKKITPKQKSPKVSISSSEKNITKTAKPKKSTIAAPSSKNQKKSEKKKKGSSNIGTCSFSGNFRNFLF